MAPRPRRKRIRAILILLLTRAIVELDNENDGTIWETGINTVNRALPLDAVADNERTSAQIDVCDHLEFMGANVGDSSATAVSTMLCDLDAYLVEAGL